MHAVPARVAITQLSGELMVMYAQGGFLSVLVGMIVGIAIHQLRLTRFSQPSVFRT
jgi:hypothetical protein